MTKTFKHPKLGRTATLDIYGKSYKMNDSYYSEEELLALGFEEETLQAGHFGNGMIGGGEGCYIDTSREVKSKYRYENIDGDVVLKYIDWSIFQTKEQAEQFDKMMMTVWKIWKWKKENDTEGGYYTLNYSNYKKIYYIENIDSNYYHDFFLPRFSSKEKVDQLISDIGEEELNNLLCWIK